MYDKLLQKKVVKAGQGRIFWLRLVSDLELGRNDYVLLLPSDCYDYNHFSLYYLNQYLRNKNSNRAIVLCTTIEWMNRAKSYSPLITDTLLVKPSEVENLLSLYCLYEFTDHLIIGSLEEPEGRMGENVIGVKGLTTEDVIKVTLYGITD